VFVGHLGLALAAKRIAPRTSLGTLVVATSLVDFLWPLLLLAGVERVRIAPSPNPFLVLDFESYPVSHAAALVVAWAAAFAAVVLARTRYARGALVAGTLVASHWVLDAVAHRPDLPVWPGGPKVGLGLWRSVPAAVGVELAIFAAGIAVYLASTRARDAVGRWALAGWVGLLLLVFAGSFLGPPPPGVGAIAVANLLGGALTVAWAAWLDRHRAVAARPSPAPDPGAR
jgi:hypothetical protein